MKGNWYLRILALLLALLSWYLVTGRERVDTWVRVKLEMTGFPDGLVLVGTPRNHLDVLVRGPKGLIRKIEPEGLVYTVDTRSVVPGPNTLAIDTGALPVSKLFEIMEVRPSVLELEAQRRMTRNVPVRLVLTESSARDQQASSVLEPAAVSVTGPESVVRDLKDIPTQPVMLPEDLAGKVERSVALVLPEQTEASSRVVKATITYAMQRLDVALETPLRVSYEGRARVTVRPAQVAIRVRAPVILIRDASLRPLVDAFVPVPPSLAPGRHQMPYRVTLPQGCELLEAKPDKATVLVTISRERQ